MLFPITRHIQRYEYIAEQGYVTDKTVLDVGCAYGYGTTLLAFFGTEIVGVDPVMADFVNKGSIFTPTFVCPGRTLGKRFFYPIKWEQIEVAKTKVDVVIAMEFIEHIRNPEEFLTFASKVGDYLFLSTPLAEKTGPTENLDHVVEFSHDDLVKLVGKEFEILNMKYQTGDLQIVDATVPNGSSLNKGHVVQILWCKRKDLK